MEKKQEKGLNSLEKNELENLDIGGRKDESQESKVDDVEIKEKDEGVGIEELKGELQAKEQKIKELESLIEEQKERHLRLQADFDNYRKRVARERENVFNTALEDIMTQLLPIIDNFDRALDSFKSGNLEPEYYEGLEMIYKEFITTLNKNGLSEIEALNCTFDPNIHHAVMKVDSEGDDENTIKEVFQKGYMLNNKVIRPSMVKVAVKN
ncbi:MAG: nucleotide exchange factor GrpE [Clostridiales bacterium]|nr:nucleotide exchange factor GrpE [Clostridiales bacterium]